MSNFSRFCTPNSTPLHDTLRLLLEEFAASRNQSTLSNPSPSATTQQAFSPNFDMYETEHQFVLEGDLPGLVDKSKVNVEFTNCNTLFIGGKIERSCSCGSAAAEGGVMQDGACEEGKNVKHWTMERAVGDFHRKFMFPVAVNVESVTAQLEHGVLRVVVPKMAGRKGRKIEIF